MLYVESFFVRRLFIGRATANINRILLSVLTEMDRADLLTRPSALPVDGPQVLRERRRVRTAVRAMPFYLDGGPGQRALVLRWLEESYGSKEPVKYDSLTIEHVMPQTPTPAWRRSLARISPDETLDEVHGSLVHTLGNLTLTGYNSTLSNKPFAVKREQLHKSGIAMNQEIAGSRLGPGGDPRPRRPARQANLEDWPGPVDADPEETGARGMSWPRR